jgi:hypothetical protein
MQTALSTIALPAADQADEADGSEPLAFPLRLLSDEIGVDRELGEAASASRMLAPLTGLTVVGFAAHAACVTGMAWPSLGPSALHFGAAWFVASTGGFFAAICAGLPSYWFYGVVAKIRAPAWRLAVELVRIQAIGAVVLAGILPFWFALSLGLHLILGIDVFTVAPWKAVTLVMPFLCGLPGLLGLYRAFCRMRDALGETGRLPPVLLAGWWSLLFVTTAPVTIWALFHALI